MKNNQITIKSTWKLYYSQQANFHFAKYPQDWAINPSGCAEQCCIKLNFGRHLTVPCVLVLNKVLSHLYPWAEETHFSSGLVLPFSQTHGQVLDLCSSLVSSPVFGPFFYTPSWMSLIIICLGEEERGAAVDGSCYQHSALPAREQSVGTLWALGLASTSG